MFIRLSFKFVAQFKYKSVQNLLALFIYRVSFLYHVLIARILCVSLTYCAFCVQICRGFKAEPLLCGKSGTLGSEQTWNCEPVQHE